MDKNLIFEERTLSYYSEQKQTGIIVSISQEADGVPSIKIRDKYGRIEPDLQDIPVLINMLVRISHSEL